VSVCLKRRQRSLVLEISDSGRGFDVSAPQHGLGLASMRERAGSVGGALTVTSAPGTGTKVRLTVPAAAVSGMLRCRFRERGAVLAKLGVADRTQAALVAVRQQG
jgi:signal transduction histidine kinase